MSGFDANDSNFTGVAFVQSFFNGNGTSGDGDGIRFLGGTIDQGQVTLYQGGMSVPAITTGFTLKDSQVNGNASRGLEIDTVTGTDLTLTGDIIAENSVMALGFSAASSPTSSSRTLI